MLRPPCQSVQLQLARVGTHSHTSYGHSYFSSYKPNKQDTGPYSQLWYIYIQGVGGNKYQDNTSLRTEAIITCVRFSYSFKLIVHVTISQGEHDVHNIIVCYLC